MKIDRLIGILSVLLQNERVTAPYLAERFEVSRRTISRDIEDINKAGIPIVTTQGKNGGISIMEGYRLDRTLLTRADMQAILAGLKSLDSISSSNKYRQLMEKLSPVPNDTLSSNDHILINLSSWRKSTLAPKIERIQAAINDCEKLEFTYFAPTGESSRMIEPYLLLFQWSSWYVWGYCCLRSDFRMFKLNRMTDLHGTGETYRPRQVSQCQCGDSLYDSLWNDQIEVTVRFRPEVKWRLIEEFGIENLSTEEDGSILCTFGWSDKPSLFGWLLGFKEQAEIIAPREYREEMAEVIQNIVCLYQKR